MKKIRRMLAFLAVLLWPSWIGFSQIGCPPGVSWELRGGGAGRDVLYSLQLMPDGGLLSGGSSSSPGHFSVGPELPLKRAASYGGYDFWILRLDASGQRLWDRSFGGSDNDGLASVLPTADGGFLLAGESYSAPSGSKTSARYGLADYWVVRVDSQGNQLWDRSFGGDWNQTLARACPAADGGWLLGGSSVSGVSGNKTVPTHGAWDWWVVCLRADGSVRWQQSLGGVNNDFLNSLQPTRDGGFILAGSSESAPGGNKTSPAFGAADVWLVKLDSAGQLLWQRSYGGSGVDGAAQVQVLPDGGFIVAAASSSGIDGNKEAPGYGDADFWVLRLDAQGNKQWETSFGGNYQESWPQIVPVRDGGFFLGGPSWSLPSGNKTSPAFGDADFWVLRLNSRGAKIWEQSFGGAGYDFLTALQQNQNEQASFLAGGYSTTVVPSGGGDLDLWLLQLDPEADDCDEDGVPNGSDLCPGTSPGAITDSDGCTIEQLVPCDGPWKSHGEYVQAVVDVANQFRADNLITDAMRRQIIQDASKSDCGRE